MNLKSFGAGFLAGLAGGTLLRKLLVAAGKGVRGLYQVILDETKQLFNDDVVSGTFDMRKTIESDFQKFRSPSSIRTWLRTYVKKHRYHGIMLQGQLYMYDYDPLHKDTLEYYDTSPLVLSFGLYYAKTGNLIEYGVNLHMLPIQIRKEFMTDVFNLFKKQYRGQMYSNKPRSINEFSWETLQTFVNKYGIDFAVRSYIVERRKNTIIFDYSDWGKAVMVPSKGYVGTDDKTLIRLYKHYMLQRKLK